jgi:methylase of polypeptide subunit release factors
MTSKIDIMIFNPVSALIFNMCQPYVVTPQEELDDAQKKKGIEASWAGGKDGIQVLLKLLP